MVRRRDRPLKYFFRSGRGSKRSAHDEHRDFFCREWGKIGTVRQAAEAATTRDRRRSNSAHERSAPRSPRTHARVRREAEVTLADCARIAIEEAARMGCRAPEPE